MSASYGRADLTKLFPTTTTEEGSSDKQDPILSMLLKRGQANVGGDVGSGLESIGLGMRSDAMGARNQDIETGSNGVQNINSMLTQLDSMYKNRQASNQRVAGLTAMGSI